MSVDIVNLQLKFDDVNAYIYVAGNIVERVRMWVSVPQISERAVGRYFQDHMVYCLKDRGRTLCMPCGYTPIKHQLIGAMTIFSFMLSLSNVTVAIYAGVAQRVFEWY